MPDLLMAMTVGFGGLKKISRAKEFLKETCAGCVLIREKQVASFFIR
jgi:hypothetical protein